MRFEAPPPPDWRWVRVSAAAEEGNPPPDPFLRDVYNVMRDIKSDPDIKEALYLYHVPVERDTLMAFFLSGATISQAAVGTGVRPEVLNIFEGLFIDRKSFKNKIEWRMYAQYYIANRAVPATRKQIEAGVAYGPTILIDHWTMGNEVPEVPEREMLSRWAMTAYSKAIVARNAPLTSAAAKEAFRWGGMAIKSVMDLKNARADTTANLDAVIAIEQRRDAMLPSDLGLNPADFVH